MAGFETRITAGKLKFDSDEVEWNKNVCIWWDGTLRPVKGHIGNCKWAFDGAVHYHLPLERTRFVRT